MRIWCCLCFGEEEKEDKEKEAMELGNESEAKPEDMENDEVPQPLDFDLGFLESQYGDAIKGLDEKECLFASDGVTIGSLRNFHGMAESSGSGKGVMEVNLNLGLGGESSASSAALERESAALDRENCDRDSHNKRPKVHSFSLDWGGHFASATSDNDSYGLLGRDYNINQSSFNNEVQYLSPILSDGGNENPIDSVNRREDVGDGCNTSKMEDLELRMDLTDDLLHMVFSFLDPINRCRAAKVCRQWRMASAHEDFWRILDFENRNISLLQWTERQWNRFTRHHQDTNSINMMTKSLRSRPQIYKLA